MRGTLYSQHCHYRCFLLVLLSLLLLRLLRMFTRGSFTILMCMGPPGLGWTHDVRFQLRAAEVCFDVVHECFAASANHTSSGDIFFLGFPSKSPKPKTCHHALRDLEVLSLKAMKVKHKHSKHDILTCRSPRCFTASTA